jgi:glycosyltransferase involved in cell wall biosynthesis
VRILWLSCEPVAEGALGVTGRVEAVRYLLGKGHDVLVVCGARPSDSAVAGIPTRRIPTRYVPLLAWVFQLPGVLRVLRDLPHDPDVVVSDFALLPAVMRWAASRRRAGAPAPRVVLDVRSQPVEAGRVRGAIQRIRFAFTLGVYGRRVDAISAVSVGLAEHVARLAKVDRGSITVWQAGCAWCDADVTGAPWPAELDPALRDRFVVLYHGSISGARGVVESLRAVDLATGAVPEIALVLLGAGSAVPELRALVADLGIGGRVSFVDPVPHRRVPEFLRAADVGLVPLPALWQWEVNFPVKLVEYLCAGLPVVLTDMKAHRIVPADARFAFWAESAEPTDLAAALVAAAGARAELPGLGAEARSWAAPRFAPRERFADLERLLEDQVPRHQVGAR